MTNDCCLILQCKISLLKKRFKTEKDGLLHEIERLQAKIIKADSTEHATGMPSLHLSVNGIESSLVKFCKQQAMHVYGALMLYNTDPVLLLSRRPCDHGACAERQVGHSRGAAHL